MILIEEPITLFHQTRSYPIIVSSDTNTGSAGQASYDKLEVWLRFCAVSLGDMAQTRVSLGPRGSYFATSPAGSVISNDLPSSFEHLINPQQSGRIPTWVALGVNDAWFALWPNSSCSCHLRDEYPDLETLLKKHGKAGVKV